MPALSMFYGIIVRMQSESGGKHNLPHLHAIYNEFEAVYALDGALLEGSLPLRQSKLLLAWMEIHSDELIANWNMLKAGEGFFRIDPLK